MVCIYKIEHGQIEKPIFFFFEILMADNLFIKNNVTTVIKFENTAKRYKYF